MTTASGWTLVWCREDGLAPSADAALWLSDDPAVVHCLAPGESARYVEVDVATGIARRDVTVRDDDWALASGNNPRWRLTAAAHVEPGVALLGTVRGNVVLFDTREGVVRTNAASSGLGGAITRLEVCGTVGTILATIHRQDARLWGREAFFSERTHSPWSRDPSRMDWRNATLSRDGLGVAHWWGDDELWVTAQVPGMPDVTRYLPCVPAAVAFDADPRHLWVAGVDGAVRCYPVAQGAAADVRAHGVGRVRALHATGSPGDVLIHDDGGLGLVRGGRSPTQRLAYGVTGDRAAFSRDGRRAVFAHGAALVFVDTAAGEARELLATHDGPVRAAAFAPDGSLAATGGDDNVVRVWNTVDGGTVWVLEGHDDPVHAVAFAPDEPRLYSVSARGVVKAWDLTLGRELASYDLPECAAPVRVGGLRVSPDGDFLCVLRGAAFGATQELDLRACGPGSRGSEATLACEDVRYTPDGSLLSVHAPRMDRGPHWTRRGAVTQDAGPLGDRRWRTQPLTSLAPDGDVLAHCRDDRMSRFVVRSLPGDEVLASVDLQPPRPLRHLTLGRRRIAAAVGYTELWAWDRAALGTRWRARDDRTYLRENRRQESWPEGTAWRRTLPGDDRVTSLALSDDESLVLVGTKRGAVMCWRVP